jgi:hypothetical protein
MREVVVHNQIDRKNRRTYNAVEPGSAGEVGAW